MKIQTWLSIVLSGCLLLSGGCSAFKSSVKPVDIDKAQPMDADYDYSDMRWLGSSVSQDLLASDFLKGLPNKPTFVIMGVQNRTKSHIDTKAITDTMRGDILNKGKANFVNEARRDDLLKEQGYQLSNCTPETRTAIGKQLGANYMITGSMVQIDKKQPKEIRLSKKEEIYYQLTMEVTDLTTGLITWQTQKERARWASKPVIGW